MGVEHVVTVGKHTALLAVGKLRQVDGAVVERAVGVGWVGEDGKEFERARKKALGRDSNSVVAARKAWMAESVNEKENDYEEEEKNGWTKHDFAISGILCFIIWIHEN